MFGSRTFVTISWMCKKQTSVSHSSSESEIMSLDAGLRIDGPLALDLWDVGSFTFIEESRITNPWASRKLKSKSEQKGNRDVDQLSHVDYGTTNANSSQPESQLYIFEGSEAAITRSITKWTKACDKRLNRLISHIHHTCDYKQYCHVGNTAKQCRLGLFQDSDFAGDLEDSKSTSVRTLCVFGSHTFVPRSWMCTKQTAVSHSSTESEIISLDIGLRLDGLPALELWDLIVSVFGNVSRDSDRSGKPENGENKSHNKIDAMHNIDSVPSNVQSARQEALLYVFEDNEAVIKMIVKRKKSYNETCFQNPQSCS